MKGISGGSWATAVFTYPQNPSITDEEFLGNIRMPEDITTNNLKEMSENCALSFVNKNVVEISLEGNLFYCFVLYIYIYIYILYAISSRLFYLYVNIHPITKYIFSLNNSYKN